MKTSTYLKQVPYWLLLVLLTVLFVYPFWWMVVNSLNVSAEIFGAPKLLPTSWAFSNYRDIFTVQPFARHYANTLVVALLGTFGNVLLSALAGYAFARMHFPFRNAAFLLFSQP
jgi:multiple sugar transport system permease protein